jgi:methyl-accepting chemotaxis protein
VVADEVRKLAERTALSTRDIADMIASIRTDTNAVTERMGAAIAKVSAGIEQARHAGNAITQIDQASRRVVEMVAEMSDALREQRQASRDMARGIEQVSRLSEEANAAIQATARASGRLA